VSRIDLTWTDNSSDETSFLLERSTSSTFGSVTSFTLATNSTGFSDTALNAGTTYYYRVKAVNGGGASG
jgi:Fibronectin type III domain